MKNKVNIYFLLLVIFLSSCVDNKPITTKPYKAIDRMIDGYINYNYESPSSLQELIAFCEENKRHWCDEPYADDIECTLFYLNQNKEKIVFSQKNDDLNKENILIMCEKDTLLFRIGKCTFPCLANMIYGYSKSYYRYPTSIHELEIYDSVTKDRQESDYRRCCDACIRKLKRSQNRIIWTQKENELLIVASGDTIEYWGNYSPCDISATYIPIVEPRFFNNNDVLVLGTEEIIKEFKMNLKQLSIGYHVIDKGGINGWHLLKYSQTDGVQPFCANDNVETDTDWLKKLNSYLENFIIEHDLGKVVFVTKMYE